MTSAPEAHNGTPPPRLSELPFPPYRFVPGKAPHPFAHPEGWGHGVERVAPPFVPLERWAESAAYLLGCDYFNHGWWWEAHEAWEELWHVTKDKSPSWGDLLKGLIQLAACALNRERGVHSGAGRLLVTARQALASAEQRDGVDGRLGGLDLRLVCERAALHYGSSGPPLPGLHLVPSAGD